jgi:hypothetical protein
VAQPFNEVQTAIVQALRANAAVQAALTGAVAPNWNILDHVPSTEIFPYIYVGDIQGQPGKAIAMGPNGKATGLLATLHIFSQYNGKKEVQGIVSAIDDVLNRKNLNLANGFTWFMCTFDNFIPLVEDDQGTNDETQHGALRYRVETQG